MLKISFNKTPTEERWILHGRRLAGPWVHELRICWKVNHRTDAGRACIVDLNEVTFIDKSGERTLRILARDGAQFTASGIYTKHVIEHLNVRRKRRLSNQLGCVWCIRRHLRLCRMDCSKQTPRAETPFLTWL
jgi:hypothetical protein